jgi:hypothetical protein
MRDFIGRTRPLAFPDPLAEEVWRRNLPPFPYGGNPPFNLTPPSGYPINNRYPQEREDAQRMLRDDRNR